MSVDVVKAVKDRRVGSPTQKLVLMVLADYADATDWATFAGQRTIAECAEVSTRTVRAILAGFESKGLIRRERRHRKDGSRSSDVITIVESVLNTLPEIATGRPVAETPRSEHAEDTSGRPPQVPEPESDTLRPYRKSVPTQPEAASTPTGSVLPGIEQSDNYQITVSEETSAQAPPAEVSTKRDPYFDAVEAVFRIPRPHDQESLFGAIAAKCRKQGHPPDEIKHRALAHVATFNFAFTPASFLKRWDQLGSKAVTLTPAQRKQAIQALERQERRQQIIGGDQ